MEKEIYQDEQGLYYVEYDDNNNPIKVYCDENGDPIEQTEAIEEIYQDEQGLYYVEYDDNNNPIKVYCDENGDPIEQVETIAEIYQDEQGLYYVEYDANNNPIKVYCDENGDPIEKTEAIAEIYQDEQGLYYVGYDANNNPTKVYCDENGNRLVNQDTTQATTQVTTITESEKVDTSVDLNNPSQNASSNSFGQDPVLPVMKKRSKTWLYILISLLCITGLGAGGYFTYTNFLAKPSVNLENYEVSFAANGSNGAAKPAVKIEKIPVADNVDSNSQEGAALDKLLAKPIITYSKSSELANGDQVEVKVSIDPEEAKKNNINVKGEFKKTFTVSGLSEAKEEAKKEAKVSQETKEDKGGFEPKNWFASNGVIRSWDPSHPDQMFMARFNSWAANKSYNFKRYKGGSVFNGITLGDKVIYDSQEVNLRFLRDQGNDQANIKAGEFHKDKYNVIGIFSDLETSGAAEHRILVVTVYNNKVVLMVNKFSRGEKPDSKDGVIEFEKISDTNLEAAVGDIVKNLN